MLEIYAKIIESLPKVSSNWKALLFLGFFGLFLGFTGWPLWLVYRNEREILDYFLNLNPRKVEAYPRAELLLVRDKLKELIKQTNANRAIFGIIENSNRIILVESYAPLEEPLPLGFQSVYLETTDYENILNTLRSDQCVILALEGQGSYFAKELELSNASLYLACPSGSNWFIALYLPEENPEAQVYLERTTEELKTLLTFEIGN